MKRREYDVRDLLSGKSPKQRGWVGSKRRLLVVRSRRLGLGRDGVQRLPSVQGKRSYDTLFGE